MKILLAALISAAALVGSASAAQAQDCSPRDSRRAPAVYVPVCPPAPCYTPRYTPTYYTPRYYTPARHHAPRFTPERRYTPDRHRGDGRGDRHSRHDRSRHR